MEFTELLKNYWSIIVAIIGGYTASVVTWVKLTSAINQLSKRDEIQEIEIAKMIQRMDSDFASNAKVNQQIQVDLSAIKTAIEFIRVEIAKIK